MIYYDAAESQAEEMANRQMEADQAQFEREVMRELEERQYAERMKDKWPGVLSWPGKQTKHARPEAACVDLEETASTQLTPNRNPK